ncbi:MAG TPA: rhomboid family intramembrane serine protease [Pseudonocardiaceae bacterium]
MTAPPPPGDLSNVRQGPAVCVRHPDRPTGLRCVRCDRPACPECLREASVGYQCVDCVNQGRATVRRGTTVAGATPGRALVVVPSLIVLNVAIFAFTAFQAQDIQYNERSELFQEWVLWPVFAIGLDQPWRLLTAGFLHYGPLHLALNMLALWILGREIEPLLGRARFAAVYLLALFGGSVAVFQFGAWDARTAGASGAVWGIMAALLVALVRLKLDLRPVLGVILINVFISFLPGVSLLGHLGGFVAGAAATAALVYAPRDRRTLVQVGALVTIGLVLLGITALRWAELTSRIG